MAVERSTPDPSEEPLRKWQESGDVDALNELLHVEVRVLKHMIRGRRNAPMAGSAATSDIAQEAVLGLLKARKPPTFANPGALRGYLLKSAWNLLVTRYEKKNRMPLRVDVEADSGIDRFLAAAPALSELDRSERKTAIDLAMNLLAQDDREILRLVYFEGQDIASAGRAVGLRRDVANTRLVRARRLIATRLSEWSDLVS